MGISQAAFTDEATAYDEVTGLILDVAGTREWSDADTEQALADVDAAHEDAEGWFWWSDGDATAFWSSLRDRAATWTMPGADKLQAVFGSAMGTIATIEEENVNAADVVVGTVEGSIEDVEEAAEEVADTVRSPWFWPGVALLGGLVLWGTSKAR